VNQPTTQTSASAAGAPVTATATATDGTLTAVAATAPGATLLKAPVAAAAVKTAATPGNSDTTPSASDPSATTEAANNNNVTPQPTIAGNGALDSSKADAANAPSPALTTALSANEHSPAAGTGHTVTDPSDAGAQLTGAIQPQPTSPPITAAPVAALSATVATNAAVPLSGLALEIAVSARSGKSRFEIRLDPADLGRIDVRIDVDRNGQVTSHLSVEKPETLSLLRQDAPQLQQALNDAGLKTGNGGLQFSLRDQSSSGQNSGNEAGRNAQRLIISDEDAAPAVIAGRGYGRTAGSSSGVDIRV
jgi:flagellar hook-length control protein FliK